MLGKKSFKIPVIPKKFIASNVERYTCKGEKVPPYQIPVGTRVMFSGFSVENVYSVCIVYRGLFQKLERNRSSIQEIKDQEHLLQHTDMCETP